MGFGQNRQRMIEKMAYLRQNRPSIISRFYPTWNGLSFTCLGLGGGGGGIVADLSQQKFCTGIKIN